MNSDASLEINEGTYQWSVRVFTLLRKVLKVHLKLHREEGQIESGDIFLFNHFARFETFIPQYFIFQESGAYCRSVASSEFFDPDAAFASYLRKVGAVPNDHPGLLPFLATEILLGRKVIVFPEGGMVKDRRVLDDRGRYSIYSRSAQARRKHHSGAAVLALRLDAFKHYVRHAHRLGDHRRIERWAETVGSPSPEALLSACRRPTRVVPANITFYPLRVRDNLLRRGADLLSTGGGLSRRLSEELLIEGNILLKDTDMDIRLARPVDLTSRWRWWERKLIESVVGKMNAMDEVFDNDAPHRQGGLSRWNARILDRAIDRQSRQVRDDYMHRMYVGVTVNLSHLASCLILALLDAGQIRLEIRRLRRLLYRLVKKVQRHPSIHLHRSVRNPEKYRGLIEGECPGFQQFLSSIDYSELVSCDDTEIEFLAKLREEHGFDEVRLENVVEVYANEVAPLPEIRQSVRETLAEGEGDGEGKGDGDGEGNGEGEGIVERALSELRFSDEQIAHAWDRAAFSGPRHADINAQETATEPGAPFWLRSRHPRRLGVVLIHGFLASPAEVLGLGRRLHERGFDVIGVRLKGHATSPWDLRERTWRDWLGGVQRGHEMMQSHTERVALVGFSTGGALALLWAASQPPGLSAVVAASVPLRFRNRNMRYVPIVHGANRLIRWVSSSEGVMPFRANDSEHPHINYRQIPIRGLYELGLLVAELESRLSEVTCPVTLFQGDRDPVVEPESAELIARLISNAPTEISWVESDRHGIVYDDIGGTQDRILARLEGLDQDGAQSAALSDVPGAS